MNERIQELIKECTIITTDMVYDGRDSFLEQTKFFDKEKFAELIVRECGQIAIHCDAGCGDLREGISQQIKQHFGVE